MQYFALVSFVCIVQSLALPLDSGEVVWEQMWLNFEVEMVNASKFADIPATVWSFPRPQLSNCITSEQRMILRGCIDEQLAKNSRMTTALEESSRLMMQSNLLKAPWKVLDCVLLKIEVRDNKTEDINMKSLVMGLVTASSLSDKEKSKAAKDLESCFESDWTMPTPLSGHHDQNKTMPEEKKNYIMANKKAMICALKALIQNGCGEAPQPKALNAFNDRYQLSMTKEMPSRLASMRDAETNNGTTNDENMDPESVVGTGDGVTARAARITILQTGWR